MRRRPQGSQGCKRVAPWGPGPPAGPEWCPKGWPAPGSGVRVREVWGATLDPGLRVRPRAFTGGFGLRTARRGGRLSTPGPDVALP